MDLSSITAEPREVHIVHPSTSERTGLVFKVRPSSHPEVKAVQRKITTARLSNLRRVKLTAEQIEANGLELLISAVEGWEWSGDASFSGEKLAFSEANLRKVLKVDWIRRQLDEELGDEASFFSDSVKN